MTFSANWLSSPIFAQAAGNLNVTAGQGIAAMLVLLTMMGSLAMIGIWVQRASSWGYFVPAAERGIVKVPVALLAVTLSISVLFTVLVMAGTLFGSPDDAEQAKASSPKAGEIPIETTAAPSAPPDGVAPEPAVETSESAVSSPSNPSATPPASPSKTDPEEMRAQVINTIILDSVLFAVLALTLWVTRHQGRPRLENVSAASAYPSQSTWYNTPVGRSAWPDLEEDNGAPGVAATSTRDSSLLNPADNNSGHVPATTDAVTTNGSNATSDGQQAAAGLVNSALPEEQFSFLRELRYAAEVFLASYLPTTVLRIVMFKLIEGATGAAPEQHPFLEMLEAGVSPALLGLIILTAVVFAPVVEELQFRVVILGGIAQQGYQRTAMIVASVLFAFAHGFPDCFALLPLAFALGYAYRQRRSYLTIILVHFLFNSFNMCLALLALF